MHGIEGLLEISAILVCGAFVFATLFARFGLPSIPAYILAGALLGPHTFGLIADGEALSTIGEIGVVLLLFTLGLEFSFNKLIALRRLIFGVGALQVLLTTSLVAIGATVLFDMEMTAAFIVGGVAAMSSTALCLKSLASIDALGRPEGRMAIAVLLFQDLAAVAFLLLHDSAASGAMIDGLLTLTLGAAALIAGLFLARGPVQTLAQWISGRGDTELAQLLALSMVFGSSLAAVAIGLSPALAAFAAGMLISEGDARNIVEREIRPFRDLFLGVFFLSVGTQIQISADPVFWRVFLLGILLVTFFKFIVIAPVLILSGADRATAIKAGGILSQGSEFGLVLLTLSASSGLLTLQIVNPILTAIACTMIISGMIITRVLKY